MLEKFEKFKVENPEIITGGVERIGSIYD